MQNFNFKSLKQANIVFVFDPNSFRVPDNQIFLSLFEGADGVGSRFADDPVSQTKFLDVPAKKLRIVLEGTRLRIDDLSEKHPEESNLLELASMIFERIGANCRPIAYGFNFDLYYRFPEMIPAEYLFKMFASEKLLSNQIQLKDLGVQFSLVHPKKEVQEVVFVKITAPLEIAVHFNHHVAVAGKVPEKNKLAQEFKAAYERPDEVVNNLKF